MLFGRAAPPQITHLFSLPPSGPCTKGCRNPGAVASLEQTPFSELP